jgi:transposase
MSSYRMFTIAFKRQVAQEYLAGISLNALARKHEVARNLVRIWVAKYQAGEFEPDFVPMPRLSAHEIKIAELERMVGKLTMELEFLRGVLRSTPLQRGAITSIVTGPAVSPSSEDANSRIPLARHSIAGQWVSGQMKRGSSRRSPTSASNIRAMAIGV